MCKLFSIVMGKHLSTHGDGVKDIAFEVEDCIGLYKVLSVTLIRIDINKKLPPASAIHVANVCQ